jgi:hypothetical protein
MKTLLKLLVSAVCLLASFCVLANEPEDTSRAGTVKTVYGPLKATGPRGERALRPGDTVSVGDQVQVAPDGAASIVMRDGTTIVLGANAQFEVRSFAFDARTQQGSILFALLKGSMRMITGIIGKVSPDSVRIKTPTTTIGVLGTDFIVTADSEAP